MKDKTNLRGVNTNLSYFTLRKIIGWSGLLLPFLVWLIAWTYEPSISDYYYTISGVLFTSVITLVGIFLMSYRGYEQKDEKFSDNVITWIGGILIVIVAAVPTPYIYDCICPTPICHQSKFWGAIHFGSASLFFVVMGYLSVFNFTRGEGEPSPDKKVRNFIYQLCGYGMWLILALAGIMIFILELNKEDNWSRLVFWVEVALLILFGTSWLVKGKALVDLGLQNDEDIHMSISE